MSTHTPPSTELKSAEEWMNEYLSFAWKASSADEHHLLVSALLRSIQHNAMLHALGIVNKHCLIEDEDYICGPRDTIDAYNEIRIKAEQILKGEK